ncbi:hypothetical protein LRP49_15630 [Enterovibrio sp. ZSDZ35]|uniref:Sigma-54 factor interaction domain-containing protein n=1 Tax=Enterovibrio qingdaonensis TaxID=2899818 RepID=A0ABT5QNN9_9GAMM|nr:helix-turn-helix domain-containing protein [Enterovibrio sp. ZSDZ35]MDD1782603.1 hypothetical protein [Enterovibrio sp. ZSDZ35]
MRRSGDRYKKWQLHTQNHWPNRKEIQEPLVQSWWEDRELCAFDWQIQKKPAAELLLNNRNGASSYLDYLFSADLLSQLGDGAAWCLLDNQGVVLSLLASPSVRPLIEERGISEGFSFAKADVGTTAFSLAQSKTDSALVYCYETYKKSLHVFASVCVPVKNDTRGYFLMALFDEEHEKNLVMTQARLERLVRYPSENLSKVALYSNILDALPQMIFVLSEDGKLKYRNEEAKRNSTAVGILVEGITAFTFTDMMQATDEPLNRTLPSMRVSMRVEKRTQGTDVLCFVTVKSESINDDTWKYRVVGQCLGKDSFLDKAIAQRAKGGLRLFLTSDVGAGEQYVVRYIAQHFSEKTRHTLDCMAGFSGKSASEAAKIQFINHLQNANGHVLCIENIHALATDLKSTLLKFLSTGLITDHDSCVVPLNIELVCCSSPRFDWQESRISRLLFLMLSGMQLDLKPLSSDQAKVDVALDLALEQLNLREGKHYVVDLIARDALLNYRWPGNYLELFQVVENAALRCVNDTLSLEDLPERMKQKSEVGSGFANIIEAERNAIIVAWRENGGRVTRVANALGLSRTTLWRKMKKLELDRQGLVEGKY